MTFVLLKILRPLAPYLIGLAVILGAILYVGSLRHHLAAANAQNIALSDENQADVAAIAAYRAQQAKWSGALATLDSRTLSTNTSINHIADGIGAAPASDDGPVAPVLKQALDGLRALQAGAP